MLGPTTMSTLARSMARDRQRRNGRTGQAHRSRYAVRSLTATMPPCMQLVVEERPAVGDGDFGSLHPLPRCGASMTAPLPSDLQRPATVGICRRWAPTGIGIVETANMLIPAPAIGSTLEGLRRSTSVCALVFTAPMLTEPVRDCKGRRSRVFRSARALNIQPPGCIDFGPFRSKEGPKVASSIVQRSGTNRTGAATLAGATPARCRSLGV